MAKDARVYEIDLLTWQASRELAGSDEKLLRANQLATGISSDPHKFAIRQNMFLGEVALYRRQWAVVEASADRLNDLATRVGQAGKQCSVRAEAAVLLACAMKQPSVKGISNLNRKSIQLNARKGGYEYSFITQLEGLCDSNKTH